MVDKNRLYERSPKKLQHLALIGRGHFLRHYRFGPPFATTLRRYQDNQSQGFRCIDRNEALHKLIAWHRDTPFVRSHRHEEGAISTKQNLLHVPHDYRNPAVRHGPLLSTSGTSGTPLVFRGTRQAVQHQWAVWWRFRSNHGLRLSDHCAHFGGQSLAGNSARNGIYWSTIPPMRLTYYSPVHLTEATVDAYVAQLNHERPTWIHGYPSVLRHLAVLMQDASLSLSHSPRVITTGAESLDLSTRELLSATLHAPVFQHYGQVEGVANFSECHLGNMHVDEDYALVDFIPDTATGALRIIGTNLTNAATLFLRYDTGDLAAGVDSGCACGLPGRYVNHIVGRTSDFLQMASGELVGPANQLLKGLAGVSGGALQTDGQVITAHLVPGTGFDPRVATELCRRLRARTPTAYPVIVQAVDHIPAGASGKSQVILPANVILQGDLLLENVHPYDS
jgi:phenylacetate-CoA ligase